MSSPSNAFASASQAFEKGFNRERWKHPSADFSQCPFWFWNDDLTETELFRQMADFRAHGVDAFVIHPRIGLPLSIGWLSEKMFHFMRLAIEEAHRTGMWIVLYDEGMYPSGSAGGLVVARDPSFHVRGLTCHPAGTPPPDDDSHLVANVRNNAGAELVIYDQRVDSVIRGLHYVGAEMGEGTVEETPPAADLLNPRAVECFIELVYGRFYQEFGAYFGNTIKAIFTDEPHPLGRLRSGNPAPGTSGILEHVNAHLGYDFTPHLPSLWSEEEPDVKKHRRDYAEAISARMDETYYRPLYEWCGKHGIALTGHPAEPDDFGHLDYFQMPGQDIVWRHVEPYKPSALQGAPSTMAKAAASAKFHNTRSRNINEFAGAFGEELTFDELQWLASWLMIRGCDLLMPHAFYYSMRGPRRTERPPDVGPNNTWWDKYLNWATATKRLCWLNATFKPVCAVAILGRPTSLPWAAAKVCFENQIDFHYVNGLDLASARVEDGVLHYKNGRYAFLIAEEEFKSLPAGVRVLDGRGGDLVSVIRTLVKPAIEFDRPAPALRFRHLSDGGATSLILLFNEEAEPVNRQLQFHIGGEISRLNVDNGTVNSCGSSVPLQLKSLEWAVFLIE